MPLLGIAGQFAPKARVVCAVCASERELAVSSLRLGNATQRSPNVDAIVLPVCSCGAQETLIRTFDERGTIPASQSRHRAKVNALAAFLKGNNLVHADLVEHFTAETKAPAVVADLLGDV